MLQLRSSAAACRHPRARTPAAAPAPAHLPWTLRGGGRTLARSLLDTHHVHEHASPPSPSGSQVPAEDPDAAAAAWEALQRAGAASGAADASGSPHLLPSADLYDTQLYHYLPMWLQPSTIVGVGAAFFAASLLLADGGATPKNALIAAGPVALFWGLCLYYLPRKFKAFTAQYIREHASGDEGEPEAAAQPGQQQH